jgi:hypothetical protein
MQNAMRGYMAKETGKTSGHKARVLNPHCLVVIRMTDKKTL